jgi:hypothetical protein
MMLNLASFQGLRASSLKMATPEIPTGVLSILIRDLMGAGTTTHCLFPSSLNIYRDVTYKGYIGGPSASSPLQLDESPHFRSVFPATRSCQFANLARVNKDRHYARNPGILWYQNILLSVYSTQIMRTQPPRDAGFREAISQCAYEVYSCHTT